MSDIAKKLDSIEELAKEAEKLAKKLQGHPFSALERIVKDIQEQKNNNMAMEFTKRIVELLKINGVVPKITKYQRFSPTIDKIGEEYGVSIDELDFSEHDKVFEDKIASLEKQIANMQSEKNTLRTRCMESAIDNFDNGIYGCLTIVKYPNEFEAENMKLKQRIAELESKKMETCEEEPISDNCRPSMEWYDNRHQSDCIEINRLNTTIDVLIHKVEYLRQFAGLE